MNTHVQCTHVVQGASGVAPGVGLEIEKRIKKEKKNTRNWLFVTICCYNVCQICCPKCFGCPASVGTLQMPMHHAEVWLFMSSYRYLVCNTRLTYFFMSKKYILWYFLDVELFGIVSDTPSSHLEASHGGVYLGEAGPIFTGASPY